GDGGGGRGGSGTHPEYVQTTTIYLHYVDGQRGDDDLTANGVIVDPGAPAYVPPAAPPPPPAIPPAAILPPALTRNQVYATQIYKGLFGVPPTPAGVAVLSQLLDEGMSRFRVGLGLVRSPDYRLLCVQKLYRTLLHRLAGRREAEQALRFLAHGGTLQQLEALLLASAE